MCSRQRFRNNFEKKSKTLGKLTGGVNLRLMTRDEMINNLDNMIDIEKKWNLEIVLDSLKNSPGFDAFVNGEKASFSYRLCDVDFLIFREGCNNIVKFFYPFPYNPNLNYFAVESFFKACKPILEKMFRDAADKRLTQK